MTGCHGRQGTILISDIKDEPQQVMIDVSDTGKGFQPAICDGYLIRDLPQKKEAGDLGLLYPSESWKPIIRENYL